MSGAKLLHSNNTLYDKAMATKAPGWLQAAGEAVYNTIPKGKAAKKKLKFSKADASRKKKMARMMAMKKAAKQNALLAGLSGGNGGS